MEFSNRNVQSQTAAPGGQSAPGTTSSKKNKLAQGKWARIGVTVAVLAVAVLLCASIVAAAFGGVKSESSYVDSTKLQAVFLNTGQVYFGNIKSLNTKYVRLTNIYYLQTSNSGGTASASSASSNVTLVKLGCELHEPLDQMLINRDQVTFWENLGDNGQVAKAVAAFEKANPSGQKCADQSTSSSTNSVNNAQNAGSSSAKP
jgi:hypothetical protein